MTFLLGNPYFQVFSLLVSGRVASGRILQNILPDPDHQGPSQNIKVQAKTSKGYTPNVTEAF